MRNSDGEIILNKNNAFEFHFTEQDRKETDEMYKRMMEMKRKGMTQEEILREILANGPGRSEA